MASYTIEDIELIRRKSGISYQEAVALLDYHNGNVARALVDLERNGRIRPENAAQPDKNAKSGKSGAHRNRSGFSNLMTRLFQFRLKVKKGDITILNLSMLFALLGVIISPHLAITAAIVILVLGYRVSFDKRDPAFASDNLEKMVRNAAQNVKSSVNDLARGFNDGFDGDAAKSAKPEQSAAPDKTEERSFYQSNPAATTYHAAYPLGADVPTLQVPVQVESQDGNVSVDSDKDGYNNATIE